MLSVLNTCFLAFPAFSASSLSPLLPLPFFSISFSIGPPPPRCSFHLFVPQASAVRIILAIFNASPTSNGSVVSPSFSGLDSLDSSSPLSLLDS
ncbi:hypothetical protein FN846DRAFT_982284 [Sphaerosporella brunnea]|uniref:REJ domain-containing protein n=1 Tax=Sphaerosporella brunnea TaxID=1250544 RepID=A0A5J5ECB3_9PEZI|nr:hypothetical protein FN846DRAFT_982284 [Sphaerosporella brunnea]